MVRPIMFLMNWVLVNRRSGALFAFLYLHVACCMLHVRYAIIESVIRQAKS